MDGSGLPTGRVSVRCGRRRLVLAGAMAAALGVGSGERSAEAYLFYDSGALDYIVPSSEAIRWSAGAWGPGRTLVWEIEDGADWSLLFDSADSVAPFLSDALSVWSGIETADISWRLASVAKPPESEETARFGDSRNRVFLERRGDYWRTGASIWWVRNRTREVWEITECDVGLPWHWWLDDEFQPEPDLDSEDLQQNITRFAAEEFGHCLGLHQPAVFPASPRLRLSTAENDHDWYWTPVWRPGSVMQWWEAPSPDDQVGASLLRPGRGWLSGTGTVAGFLETDGEPVPYAHVYAVRRTPDGMRDPVGAFANARGEFLIEGLPPGDYVLWAHPIRYYWLQSPLIQDDAETEVKDSVLAHPVRVEAGRNTEGITIPMQRGRE